MSDEAPAPQRPIGYRLTSKRLTSVYQLSIGRVRVAGTGLVGIVNVTEPILEGRQHIDVPQPQPGRDRSWHVLIQIQRERHQCPPRARRRARRGAVGV